VQLWQAVSLVVLYAGYIALSIWLPREEITQAPAWDVVNEPEVCARCCECGGCL